jgi:catalase
VTRRTRLLKVCLIFAESSHQCLTPDGGQPSANPSSALQIRAGHGNGGLSVLCDTQLIETLAHFARERIPERLEYVNLPL